MNRIKDLKIKSFKNHLNKSDKYIVFYLTKDDQPDGAIQYAFTEKIVSHIPENREDSYNSPLEVETNITYHYHDQRKNEIVAVDSLLLGNLLIVDGQAYNYATKIKTKEATYYLDRGECIDEAIRQNPTLKHLFENGDVI